MAAPKGSLGTWDARTIVSHMFPLLVILCVIVLWAGITLEEAEELLNEFGLLAIMVPTMVGAGGNLGTILSSRLTTRLHLGTTELDLEIGFCGRTSPPCWRWLRPSFPPSPSSRGPSAI